MRSAGSCTTHIGGQDRRLTTDLKPWSAPRPVQTGLDWDALRPTEPECAPSGDAPEPAIALGSGAVTYETGTADERFDEPPSPVEPDPQTGGEGDPSPLRFPSLAQGRPSPSATQGLSEPPYADLLADAATSTDPVVCAAHEAATAALRVLQVALGEAVPAAPAAHAPDFAPAKPRPAPNPQRSRRRAARATRYDHREIVRLYLEEMYSPPEIAKQLGVPTPGQVRRILDRNGVQRRDDRATHSGGRTVDYPQAFLDDVRRLYVDERLSRSQVAERLGVTVKTVQTAMRKAGIKGRPPAHLAPPSGERNHATKLTDEQRDEVVRRYSRGESGLTLAAAYGVSNVSIYAILRKRGVPRRTGGRRAGGGS